MSSRNRRPLGNSEGQVFILGLLRPLWQLLVFVLNPARDEAPGVAQLGPHMIGILLMPATISFQNPQPLLSVKDERDSQRVDEVLSSFLPGSQRGLSVAPLELVRTDESHCA